MILCCPLSIKHHCRSLDQPLPLPPPPLPLQPLPLPLSPPNHYCRTNAAQPLSPRHTTTTTIHYPLNINEPPRSPHHHPGSGRPTDDQHTVRFHKKVPYHVDNNLFYFKFGIFFYDDQVMKSKKNTFNLENPRDTCTFRMTCGTNSHI